MSYAQKVFSRATLQKWTAMIYFKLGFLSKKRMMYAATRSKPIRKCFGDSLRARTSCDEEFSLVPHNDR